MYPNPHRFRNFLILLLIAMIVVGVIAYLIATSGEQPSPTPTTHTISIANGIATVNADSYKDYLFTIPSGASNIQVSGTFTAQGGSGNDTKVYVFDAVDFDNYKNNHNPTAFYLSEQVHTALISANLPSSGDYYLVIDNLFSPQSQKTVNIQVNATYTK